MCAQLSAQIVEFELASTEHAQFSDRPSAQKYVKRGLGEIGGSVQSLVTRLRSHEAAISSQLEAISLKDGLSEPVAAQIERLNQVKESVSQCIQIVSDAKESVDERSNVFEEITLADNSYAFSVSAVNDLSGRSRHFGGQVADETVQRSMDALTQLDAEHLKYLHQTPRDQGGPNPHSTGDTKKFHDRFWSGLSLSERNT